MNGTAGQAVALARAVVGGDRRAVARLLTVVENRWPGWLDALAILYARCGRARLVGITGSAGAGKSTLTAALADVLVGRGHRVAIVAIDPSSPLSGGAVLGDRVRMGRLAERGVFIRSLATRGATGGLCQAARDVVRVLEAAGYDMILVETVGVGQDEVDIVRLVGKVLVVCTPGQGDGIQAIKAGLMEVADLLVLNKADAPGADRLESELRVMLLTRADARRRDTPVLRTVATTGEGVAELGEALLAMPPGSAAGDSDEAAQVQEVLGMLKAIVQARLARLPAEEMANPYAALRKVAKQLFPDA